MSRSAAEKKKNVGGKKNVRDWSSQSRTKDDQPVPIATKAGERNDDGDETERGVVIIGM